MIKYSVITYDSENVDKIRNFVLAHNMQFKIAFRATRRSFTALQKIEVSQVVKGIYRLTMWLDPSGIEELHKEFGDKITAD